jgi:5-methylcytosine-specific restriction endonuclease McrA
MCPSVGYDANMETPAYDDLYRLYVQELKSLAEIGRLYGVHRNQVRRWLLRAAIPTRSPGEGVSLATKGKPRTEAQLAALQKNAAIAARQSRRSRAASGRNRCAASPPGTRASRRPRRLGRSCVSSVPTLSTAARQSERQRGEKGNNWQGGQTDAETLRMQGWEWRKRRAECYERDNWTCQDCGVKCTNKGPRRIQAHHVIGRRNGGTDDLSNLVTLCLSCHHKRSTAVRARSSPSPLFAPLLCSSMRELI